MILWYWQAFHKIQTVYKSPYVSPFWQSSSCWAVKAEKYFDVTTLTSRVPESKGISRKICLNDFWPENFRSLQEGLPLCDLGSIGSHGLEIRHLATLAPAFEFVQHLARFSSWLLFVMGFLDSTNFLTIFFIPLGLFFGHLMHLATHCILPFIHLAILKTN